MVGKGEEEKPKDNTNNDENKDEELARRCSTNMQTQNVPKNSKGPCILKTNLFYVNTHRDNYIMMDPRGKSFIFQKQKGQ